MFISPFLSKLLIYDICEGLKTSVGIISAVEVGAESALIAILEKNLFYLLL